MMPHTLQDDESRLLLARLDDLSARAARGETVSSPFLTPREAKMASRHLASRLAAGTAVLWGGYPDAERVRAVLFPDYVEGMVDPALCAQDAPAALEAAGLEDVAEVLRESTILLSIEGSGYRVLSHRDYLGSVLGLGLDRDAVGDILVTGEHTACLITGTPMDDFLLSHLEKVATDAVRVHRLPAGSRVQAERRLQPITDTVASERLDCVVAALCNLSRDRAQTAIRQGLCEVDYEPAEDCDRPLSPPCVLSVRGVGKFAVHGFDGTTKKGRMRLVAGKYL